MSCKENAERDCKSYPKCEGCCAYTQNKISTVNYKIPDKLYCAFKAAGDAALKTYNDLNRKVWVTTNSSIKDDIFLKKLKEAVEQINRPKENPLLGFEHQFTTTFKVSDFNRPNKNNIIIDEKVFSNAMQNYINHDIQMTKNMYERRKETMKYVYPTKNGIRVDNRNYIPENKIKDVIFNPPATIVFWADGTKTVVKAQNEAFDPEKGLAMAILKKQGGNKGNYCNQIKKWTDKYYENHPSHKNNVALAYSALQNVLADRKATKADMVEAMDEALGFLGAALED